MTCPWLLWSTLPIASMDSENFFNHSTCDLFLQSNSFSPGVPAVVIYQKKTYVFNKNASHIGNITRNNHDCEHTQGEQAGYRSNYVSRNFEISPESRKMFRKMKKDGVPEEGLKRFAIMEDRLLEYEKDSVCKGISRKAEAIAIDQAIKDSFRGYDFKFHTKHLTLNFCTR